jgi:hypothetical protein
LGRRERIVLGARRLHACGNFSHRRTRMKHRFVALGRRQEISNELRKILERLDFSP